MLLVVKRVILWPNPVPLSINAHGGMRYCNVRCIVRLPCQIFCMLELLMSYSVVSAYSHLYEESAYSKFRFVIYLQVVFGDVYMLDNEMKWKVLPPMPKQNSHIECSWVLVNNSIVIVGGTTEKHPLTKRMMLVGEVFQFNLNTLVYYHFVITTIFI